jgi:hypothetical protein
MKENFLVLERKLLQSLRTEAEGSLSADRQAKSLLLYFLRKKFEFCPTNATAKFNPYLKDYFCIQVERLEPFEKLLTFRLFYNNL